MHNTSTTRFLVGVGISIKKKKKKKTLHGYHSFETFFLLQINCSLLRIHSGSLRTKGFFNAAFLSASYNYLHDKKHDATAITTKTPTRNYFQSCVGDKHWLRSVYKLAQDRQHSNVDDMTGKVPCGYRDHFWSPATWIAPFRPKVGTFPALNDEQYTYRTQPNQECLHMNMPTVIICACANYWERFLKWNKLLASSMQTKGDAQRRSMNRTEKI